MISSVYYKGLEKIFNCAIQAMADSPEQLAALQDKVIQLDITDWPLGFQVHITATAVTVHANDSLPANASIKGRLIDLLSAGLQGAQPKHWQAEQVYFTGDAALAHALQRLLRECDLDLEEPLSRWTGDVLAHQLGNVARALCKRRQQASAGLQRNVQTYLRDECGLLVNKQELQVFTSDVRTLRQAVERCEARLQQLLAKES